MRQKRKNSHKADLEFLEKALQSNGSAKYEGPKRKHWSIHDLKTIKPLTPTQEDVFHAWYNGANLCLHGSAGTGKSIVVLYLALQELLNQNFQKIIIVRSAVTTRDVGFLPGSLEEKLEQFETPYRNILHELVGRQSTYDDMKQQGMIEFHSTSFLRGLTWDNAIVIVDESENMTFHEIDNVMTRLGDNTRIVFTGDTNQTDLDGSKKLGSEGLTQAIKVFEQMKDFETITFNYHDIVRGPLVKSWIMACSNI